MGKIIRLLRMFLVGVLVFFILSAFYVSWVVHKPTRKTGTNAVLRFLVRLIETLDPAGSTIE